MSPSYLFIVFIALCAFTHVLGDLYMQNPRGNNDRLNEDGDRDNANRLFDSQNNAAGGYCWGPELTYYEGSQLQVQWTNQHSCGVDNTDCNIVIQYMCTSDSADADVTQIIRDGVTTTTIPTGNNPANAATYYNAKTGNAYTYGMNEDLANYQSCVTRDRNKGLFVADQNVVNNQGSMATRQNPTGTVYGFECTEENDYYPYWHPAPWKDVAVLANDASAENCAFYQSNSENVVGRYYCALATAGKYATANNEADCITEAGTWTQAASHNLTAPDCLPAPVTRDNHLGNSVTADTASYNWTLPFAEQEDCIDNGNCTCVLRMRYNITLGELTGDEDSTVSGAAKSPVTGDPNVAVPTTGTASEIYTLALDTTQTGRTFQDRSFMFRIAPRPDGLSNNVTIHNLNVRGKRGNIVQTYPATEYDFTPNALVVNQGDQIDIQWTGCDTNPAANAGEGTDSTDRSNIVQLADKSLNYPANIASLNASQVLFQDPALRTYMANIGQTNCASQSALAKAAAATKNAVAVDQNTANCGLLNAAKTPLFTGALFDTSSLTPGATYPYMSTRNNNFSNRSQKATIIVNGGGSAPLVGSVTKAQSGAIAAGIVVAVAVGALAGTVVYAKRNPHSRAADFVGKIPGLNKI